MNGGKGTFPAKSGFFHGKKPGNFGDRRQNNGGFKNNRKFGNDGGDEDGQGSRKRNFDRPVRYRGQMNDEQNPEDDGKFNKFQKKVDNDRAHKKRWEERERNGESPPEWRKCGKVNQKSNGNFKKTWEKKEPVKGTSTEWRQLANSDEDDDEIPDVTDMLPDDVGSEIPLINSGAGSSKGSKNKKPQTNSFGSSEPNKKQNQQRNVVEEYDDQNNDDEEEEEEEEPSDSDDEPGEVPNVEDNDEKSEDDGSESEDDEDERKKFREEIANMPLGKVKEMKEKLGIKLFNKTYFGVSEQEKKKQVEKKKEASEVKNLGQHRPKEMSSKRPVSSFRNIYGEHEQSAKKKRWDPRFDERSGDYKEVCFENNYQFLDEIRASEIKELKKELKNAKVSKDHTKAGKLKDLVQKMENREKSRLEKRRQMETKRDLHEENIERMLRGEAPVFKTKGQIRRIDMEKKYDELKKDNKLDKYLQRKAKKQSSKEKKARPFEGYGYQDS